MLFVLQLFDWTKSGSTERLLTFYRLTNSIAERLKGLFVLFAGNLVKPFTDLLRQTNPSKTGEELNTDSVSPSCIYFIWCDILISIIIFLTFTFFDFIAISNFY